MYPAWSKAKGKKENNILSIFLQNKNLRRKRDNPQTRLTAFLYSEHPSGKYNKGKHSLICNRSAKESNIKQA